MPKWFISAEELHQLDLDNTVIFDCRFSLADKNKGRNLYLNEHIPNAFHLDMETDLSASNKCLSKMINLRQNSYMVADIHCRTQKRLSKKCSTVVLTIIHSL